MNEGTLLNGRYQLLEKLGSGGMAEVFRARDSVLDRIVAIKVLRKDYGAAPSDQKRSQHINYFGLSRSSFNQRGL
jgi:serine/threonine-protein kinase